MNIATLMHLLGTAQQLCGHRDFVVIGSLSILGMAPVESPAGLPDRG
jgi:hypothetical protein